jgi:hypothetical protein
MDGTGLAGIIKLLDLGRELVARLARLFLGLAYVHVVRSKLKAYG